MFCSRQQLAVSMLLPLALRPKADDMNYTQARDKTITVGKRDAIDRDVAMGVRTWLFWFYPPLFFAPELLIAFDSPILAMGIYAVLLVVLVIQRAFFTRSDAERNCVSNIHGSGLSSAEAAFKIAWLIREALTRKMTGVALKDESSEAMAARLAKPV